VKDLSEWRKSQEEFTKTCSEVTRRLAYAGIAVVWIFVKVAEGPAVFLPPALMVALIFILGGLLFDYLQYAYSSAAWTIYNNYKERKMNPDHKMDAEVKYAAPACINYLNYACFWTKQLMIVIAYIIIIAFFKTTIQ
jgi:hypothetical protein